MFNIIGTTILHKILVMMTWPWCRVL